MQTHTDKQAYWSSETYCYKISLQICQRNYWSFLGNVTRHYFQWWNSWSLCQTSLMNVAEKTIHDQQTYAILTWNKDLNQSCGILHISASL